jgi:hypothetical protein
MDDLVGAYFNVYGCEVVQENFQHLGEKRYVVKENKDKSITNKEPDPFGRPGGKYGGVPKEGSGYDRGWKAMQKRLKDLDMKENIDIYDIVSEYLVSEGFCDSYEGAAVIMANMSEAWRESIMEEVRFTDQPPTHAGGKKRVIPARALPNPDSEEEKEKTERRKKRGRLSFEVKE